MKRRRPLAVALACHYLLEALAGSYRGLWLSETTDPLLVRPAGPTPLGQRIIDALEPRPDRLVIVSDGWDNAPPGLAAEVLRVWRRRLDPTGEVRIVHLNQATLALRLERAGFAHLLRQDILDAYRRSKHF